MLARIRVSLRRGITGQTENENKDTFKVKDLIVDFNKRRVMINNDQIHLTPIEYKIMALLCKYPGKVLTHNFIIHEIWDLQWGMKLNHLGFLWQA